MIKALISHIVKLKFERIFEADGKRVLLAPAPSTTSMAFADV